MVFPSELLPNGECARRFGYVSAKCSAGEAVETMGRSEESKRNARPTAALGIEAVTLGRKTK